MWRFPPEFAKQGAKRVALSTVNTRIAPGSEFQFRFGGWATGPDYCRGRNTGGACCSVPCVIFVALLPAATGEFALHTTRRTHRKCATPRDHSITSYSIDDRLTVDAMDIASLLSPCLNPAPPLQRQGSREVTVNVDDTSNLALATAAALLGDQLIANEPVRVLVAPNKNSQQLAKRKRKRRYSANQLQVMRENRHDDSLVYNLTLDVNELKQQVRNFIVHKSIHETRALVARQRFDAGILRTTEHFFQVFRTGFREWESLEAAFFDATIDSNIVVSSELRGVDVFFEQWRRYKELLQPRRVSISSANILVSDSESCVVECKGVFEGKLTLAAIETIFPHILEDAQLLSKVVNCRLICPTRTLIYFDEGGRIVQYDADADMFAGLQRILVTDPMDVITLMSNARISSEGSMIPAPEAHGRVEEINNNGLEPNEYDSTPESPSGSRSFGSASPSSSSCSSRSSVEYILS